MTKDKVAVNPKPRPDPKPVEISAGNGGRKPRRAPPAGSAKPK